MNEDFIRELTEALEHSKSNMQQITEMKEDIKNIQQEQKAIYELTSSIQIMSAEMIHIREDIDIVKDKQEELTNKMNIAEREPFTKHKKLLNSVVTAVITALATGAVIAIANAILGNGIQL